MNLSPSRRVCIFALAAGLSVSLKLYLSTRGYNYDVESWQIVSRAVLDGDAVYARTNRWPYGPLLPYALAAIRYGQMAWLKSDTVLGFHVFCAAALSLVDIAIACLLWRLYAWTAGVLFLLSPISALITGYHSQIDNVPVCLALIAIACFTEERAANPFRLGLFCFLLGLSLIAKHVFVFLPVWLMLNRTLSWRARGAMLIPYAMFLFCFIPFMVDVASRHGVMDNVFGYNSFYLQGYYPLFVNLVVPVGFLETAFSWVPVFSGFKFVWFLTMCATAWVFRDRKPTELFLIYLVAMCPLSPALADQYLAIPVAACCVWWRSCLSWWFTGLGTLWLLSPKSSNYHPVDLSFLTDMGLQRFHTMAPLFLLLCLLAWAELRKGRDQRQPP